jgi:4-alpha-glucanotransferase
LGANASRAPLRLALRQGPYGVGDLGPEAYSFVDWLHEAGMQARAPRARAAGRAQRRCPSPGRADSLYNCRRRLLLCAAAPQIWQVLPLVPPDADYWSPYSGRDAHCGNPLLLSLELLAEDGLLLRSELPPVLPVGPAQFVQARAAALHARSCAHAARALSRVLACLARASRRAHVTPDALAARSTPRRRSRCWTWRRCGCWAAPRRAS